eukprot:1246254-Rhodomonas_salina.1
MSRSMLEANSSTKMQLGKTLRTLIAPLCLLLSIGPANAFLASGLGPACGFSMWTHPVLTSRARGPLSFSMQMKLPGRKFELPALYAQRKTGYDGTSGGDNRDAKRQNSFFVMQEFLENEEDIDKSSSQQVNIRPEIRKLKVGKKTFKRRTGTITIKRQAPTLSQRAKKMIKDSTVGLAARLNIVTLLRVGLPSVVAAVLGYAYFDNISLFLFHNWLSATEIQFLSSDEVQFIPSFLQVLGLLFSILAGYVPTLSITLYEICKYVHRFLMVRRSQLSYGPVSVLSDARDLCPARMCGTNTSYKPSH